jgi:1-acyl-sn-glycerol-3-phosphate acyltransferase
LKRLSDNAATAGPDAGRRPLAASPVARRSATLHRFMVTYFRRFFSRHMNALRVTTWGMPTLPADAGPLVIYSNHPAWWDAALYVLAADRLFPQYESYAPIDAAMLQQYGVFGRIGAFGVDTHSARGAAEFLSAGAEILASPNRALWITAQGRFSDVRERPLGVKPGVARLPELAPGCTVLPLAVEYSFWLERGAEAFIAFGPPMRGRDLLALSRGERLQRLESSLTSLLDQLSGDVQTRDPSRFESVLQGRTGVGGVYDGWRRFVAALRGRSFDPSHARRAA